MLTIGVAVIVLREAAVDEASVSKVDSVSETASVDILSVRPPDECV